MHSVRELRNGGQLRLAEAGDVTKSRGINAPLHGQSEVESNSLLVLYQHVKTSITCSVRHLEMSRVRHRDSELNVGNVAIKL